MSVLEELRPTTTEAPEARPPLTRTPEQHPPVTPEKGHGRLLATALVLTGLIATAIVVAVLRSGDDSTATPLEPLIVTEEQQAIDDRLAYVPSGDVATLPHVVVDQRPGGIPNVIDSAEWAFIQEKVPYALGPSPTATQFEPLVVTEEQQAIDDRLAYVPSGDATATQAVDISERPTGIPSDIDAAEWTYVQAHVPMALGPSPAPTEAAELMDPHEQAYVDGEYQYPIDWCLTHMPC